MKKGIGVACLVVGVVLILWGYEMRQSFGGKMAQAFTGAPPEESMYLCVGGAVLAILGFFQIFRLAK